MALKSVILACLAISFCIAADECKVDFVFLVDGSGSICNNNGLCDNWRTITTFISNIASKLSVGVDGSHVGMVTFGSRANLIWDLNTYNKIGDLQDQIKKLNYLDESTNTSAALDMARTSVFGKTGDRLGIPNVVLMLTDGDPSNLTNPFRLGSTIALEAADKLKQQDVNLITVGVGPPGDIKPTLLKQLSSHPQKKDENYFTSADFNSLNDLIQNIRKTACPVTTTTTTTTTTTAPPLLPGNCLLDLTFVVDRSGSICNDNAKGDDGCDNWRSVRNFVSGFVDRLPVDDGSVRVAMVVFGSSAQVFWPLSGHSSKQNLMNAIQGIRFEAESTNTAYALELTRTNVYGMSDDRSGVANVVIMLTDGVPSNGKTGRDKAIDQATKLKNSNVKIITIGVTKHVDEDLLKEMSSNKILDQDYFLSPEFSDLSKISDIVLKGTCKGVDPSCVSRDIVIVLDASGSIRENNFAKAKSFLSRLVDDVSIGSATRMGLLTFGDNVNLQFNLNSFDQSADIKTAIEQTPYSRGTTNTADALKYVRQEMFTAQRGDRSGVEDLVIIFTDGGSDNHEATISEALKLKARGIHILVVGIGNWLQKFELQSIASHPDSKNIKYINSYDNLGDHVEFFKLYNCKRTNPCLQSPCRNGGSCVSKPDGEYYCQCKSPYGGKDCDYFCRTPKDVIFALDASGSITRENFKLVVEFAKAVTMELPVDSNSRVGLETFSDNYKEYFNLKDYQDRSLLVNMMSIPYFMDGTTNTHLALQNMGDRMFTSNNGDQSSIPNVGVVVTDGRSNNPAQTWQSAKDLRSRGVEVIAIGVSRSADIIELRGIASKPFAANGRTPNLMNVNSFNDLQSIVKDTRDTICQAVNNCNPNPCNSARCQEHMDGYICECPSGRTGNNCERNCEGEADIVFVIDNSGSIRRERFDEVKEYLISIVENLEVDTGKVNIGAVKFANDASIVFGLTGRARQDIVHQIRTLSYKGGKTNIADAIKTARQNVFGKNNDRSTAQNYLILFTDGTANLKTLETIPEAIEARIAGIKIIVAGVGMDLNKVEMAGIASYPAAVNVITTERFANIASMKQPVIDAMCNSKNECNSVSCRNGGTCVDKLNGFKCTCSNDFTGETCDRRCTASTDVVFILDLSGSVDATYDASVSFIRHVIEGLPFSFSSTRVSVITFADTSSVAFPLDRYSEKADVLNALAFYQAGGKTNTQEALSLARDQLSRNGRNGVNRRVILLTDGGSNLQRENTIPNAERIKNDGKTIIHVVAIGKYVDQVETEAIASNGVYTMADESEAKSASSRILDDLC